MSSMGHVGVDLLGGIPETLLPVADSDIVAAALVAGADPATVAARHPSTSLAWAVLAESSLLHDPADGSGTEGSDLGGFDATVAAYAYARVGYHRGLDALRRAGWKGAGPVPWRHEPNRGFLRCLRALAIAAERIEEEEEARRCRDFLVGCDPTIPERIERASA